MKRVVPAIWILPVMLISLGVSGCTSDPYAPINQTTPVRQLDNAFDPAGTRFDRAPPPQYPNGGYQPPSYSRY